MINGLTDSSHPCQALADVMTIRERFGRLEGLKVVYLGDGNNVCASLMVAARQARHDASSRRHRRATSPDEEAVRIARDAGGSVELVARSESGSQRRRRPLYRRVDLDGPGRRAASDGYAISPVTESTPSLVALAAKDAIVLHCLPAHYGEEISEDVLYGPHSAVWDEAENRLHAQKALLALVIR